MSSKAKNITVSSTPGVKTRARLQRINSVKVSPNSNVSLGSKNKKITHQKQTLQIYKKVNKLSPENVKVV